MIKVLISDSDMNYSTELKNNISSNFDYVSVLTAPSKISEIVKIIDTFQPDILISSALLSDGTYVDIIKSSNFKDFEIVITEFIPEFQVENYKINKIHCFGKPISTENILEIISRRQSSKDTFFSLKNFTIPQKNNENPPLQNIIFNFKDEIKFFPMRKVQRFESDTTFTHVVLVNHKKFIIYRSLTEITDTLQHYGFIRIHQKHLVNIDSISRFVKSTDPYVILKDKTILPISLKWKTSFYSSLSMFTKFI